MICDKAQKRTVAPTRCSFNSHNAADQFPSPPLIQREGSRILPSLIDGIEIFNLN